MAGAVYGAPALIRVYTGAESALTVAFARYCLPQIFFLGAFALLGQVLNARGRFHAMAWAPVVNNAVVAAVFGAYVVVAAGGQTPSAGEAALLGWGTTAGIAAQALVLLPSLHRAGFRWRPRFDWRSADLARPLRSAGWLVALVLCNQAAFWLVTRLASSAGRLASADGTEAGAGFSAYLLWMVPHGIVTVSLVTAAMPRISAASADGETRTVHRHAVRALRTTSALVALAACVLFAVAAPLTSLVFEHGHTTADGSLLIAAALTGTYHHVRPVRAHANLLCLVGRAYAVPAQSGHRGRERHPVHGGLHLSAARWVVTGMAAASSASFAAGFAVTARTLRRRLAPAEAGLPSLVRSPTAWALARTGIAAVPAAVGRLATAHLVPWGPLVQMAGETAAVAAVFALLCRPLRLTELAFVAGAALRLPGCPVK